MILLLVLAGAPAPVGARIDMPSPRQKWIRLQDGALTIVSSARQGATAELAENLRYMRAALGKATRLKVDSPVPVTIFVFADEKQYRRYGDAVLGHTGKRSAGVYRSHPDGDSIAIDYTGLSAGIQTLYHEVTHRFLQDTAPAAPLWLEEGLAELYSTFSRSGGRINIGIPRLDHLRTLRELPLTPLAALFAVNHQSPDYNESSRAAVFYAESWAFVHYLVIGSHEREGQLAAFFASLAAGKDTERAFGEAFSADYRTLESELRAYVRLKLFPYLTLEVGELPVGPTPTAVPMSRDEVLVELGTFLSRTSPSELPDAESLLREALRSNPANADAWALIGAIKEQQALTAEADAAFEQALAIGPGNLRANLLFAQAILRRKEGGLIVPADAPPPDVQRARGLFATGAALAPGEARAWAGLGSTYLFQRRDLQPGIAALEKALSLAPSQVDAAYNLVLLYVATDQPAKASPLIEGVLAHSSNPALAEAARRALARWAAAKSGAAPASPTAPPPPGASTSPLQGAAPPPPDGELEEAFEEARRRSRQQERELALYEAFRAKVNGGEYEGAIVIADEFLQIARIEELIREVTEVRARLVERLAKRTK